MLLSWLIYNPEYGSDKADCMIAEQYGAGAKTRDTCQLLTAFVFAAIIILMYYPSKTVSMRNHSVINWLNK